VSTNLAPVPSESATCANCGAPLVADQRYCLSCGQPCSPVRLAFLDVLDSDRQPQPGTGVLATGPVAYSPFAEPAAGGSLLARRYAPLFAVASVLLLAGIAGLLVGHWVSESKGTSGPTIVKVEGLAGAPLASSGTPTTPATPTSTAPGKATSSPKSEEAKEQAEAKAEEKAEEKAPAKAPPAKALSNSQATKLEHTTGRTKEKELSKLTTAPIEVK
jgi:hypothetical protein